MQHNWVKSFLKEHAYLFEISFWWDVSAIFKYGLEIKTFGLGSRIRDMTIGWTEHRIRVPKCAFAIVFLASNSLHNYGGQK